MNTQRRPDRSCIRYTAVPAVAWNERRHPRPPLSPYGASPLQSLSVFGFVLSLSLSLSHALSLSALMFLHLAPPRPAPQCAGLSPTLATPRPTCTGLNCPLWGWRSACKGARWSNFQPPFAGGPARPTTECCEGLSLCRTPPQYPHGAYTICRTQKRKWG